MLRHYRSQGLANSVWAEGGQLNGSSAGRASSGDGGSLSHLARGAVRGSRVRGGEGVSFGHGLLYPPGVALLVFLDRGERARVVRGHPASTWRLADWRGAGSSVPLGEPFCVRQGWRCLWADSLGDRRGAGPLVPLDGPFCARQGRRLLSLQISCLRALSSSLPVSSLVSSSSRWVLLFASVLQLLSGSGAGELALGLGAARL